MQGCPLHWSAVGYSTKILLPQTAHHLPASPSQRAKLRGSIFVCDLEVQFAFTSGSSDNNLDGVQNAADSKAQKPLALCTECSAPSQLPGSPAVGTATTAAM